ncbi:MAG: hypothetical protein AAF558_01025 [Verrucomicrobiota bacterium]
MRAHFEHFCIPAISLGCLVLVALAPSRAQCTESPQDPKALIKSSIEAMGGKSGFYAKEGVEYVYTYRAPDGKADVSVEKYQFASENSWASYSKRELMFPEIEGELVQIYDGSSTRVTLDGKPLDKEAVIQRSDFIRKTNFYWFAMMFKLLDPGLIYSYEGTQDVNGVAYDKVKITFEDGVGDVKDIYLVHIHPETKLIDRFLFTVMDFGLENPLLMTVEYKEVGGIQLPAIRRYAKAKSWEGEPADDQWTDEIMTEIQFKSIPASLFE